MTTTAPAPATDLQKSLADFLNQLGGGVMNGHSGIVPPDIFGPLVGCIHDVTLLSPNKDFVKQPQKAFQATGLQLTKEQVGQKDFWSFLGQAVSVAAPYVISAITGKDFQGKAHTPPADPKSLIPADADKDFWDALGGFLTNVAPIVIDALQGKDFNPGHINVDALPLDKDIDWGKVAQTGLQLLPFVISLF